jgi:aspartate aminotransferase-like enzyme
VGLNILLSNGGMEARFKEHRLMSKGIKEAIHAMNLNEVIITELFLIHVDIFLNFIKI